MLAQSKSILIGACIAVGLLTGCNEVLGIEEANPAQEQGSAGGGGDGPSTPTNVVIPLPTCDAPDSACADCIAKNCAASKPDCLADNDCRVALDEYRGCLGAKCVDDGSCAEALGPKQRGSTQPKEFAQCAAETCAAECSASPVSTTCELYCNCMADNCEAELGGNPLPVDKCLATCASINSIDLDCRLLHCTIAKAHPSVGHCSHAIGKLGQCSSGAQTQVSCTYASPANWPCEKGSDCCKGTCAPDTNLCN